MKPEQRKEELLNLKNLKMARSAHSYVRGNTKRFYDWLGDKQAHSLPQGPAIWICGDCHVGNLGPVANIDGQIRLQIRDVDQTVIGNPSHDLIRLGLSLAMAARGASLPGVTTAVMMEQLVEGYAVALEAALSGQSGDRPGDLPDYLKPVMRAAASRSWKQLARERLSGNASTLPIGNGFWKLSKEERSEVKQLFEKGSVARLATLLSSRPDDMPVEVLDAAYWVKGCSSLGGLRYAVLLGVGLPDSPDHECCLIDIKEAVSAAAPAYSGSKMPTNKARRVVEGARHLSPHLGERMMTADLQGKQVFMRELLPQDLKLEIDQMTAAEAMDVASHLAGVVGTAHARQMDVQTGKAWVTELKKHRSKTLDAPSWLWNSIVELVANHEAGYLEHCRRYAMAHAVKR
ncbi:MAG: DUF2252 family protein [Aquabacterium sp.]